MADEPKSDAERRRELVAELHRARVNMSRHFSNVKYQAAVPRRMKASVSRNAKSWLAGAIFTGLITGWRVLRPGPKEKKVYLDPSTGKGVAKEDTKRPSFWMSALTLIMQFVQPALTAFVTKRLTGYLNRGGGAAR